MTQDERAAHDQMRGRAVARLHEAGVRHGDATARLAAYRTIVKRVALMPEQWALRDGRWSHSAAADPVEGWPSADDIADALRDLAEAQEAQEEARADLKRLGLDPQHL